MALTLFKKRDSAHKIVSSDAEPSVWNPAGEHFAPAPREDLPQDPLGKMMAQHRYAALLANQEAYAIQQGAEQVFEQAERRLEEELALVPSGVAGINESLFEGKGDGGKEQDVLPFLLSIYPVTNARFQQFVDANGYEELELWPEEIWPHLVEFHDLTGVPAPRFWRNARHDARLANYPVVGISWYEAKAYADWVGLRLPTEAEWQMAASWRIRSDTDVYRRHPWGDSMDYRKCNIWGSGIGQVAAVDDYESGIAPNGVQQLVGNVWEWVKCDFEATDGDGRIIIAEMPMKGVRGGAFDTYFDTQATSTFRAGQMVMDRSHNTGFRCALDV